MGAGGGGGAGGPSEISRRELNLLRFQGGGGWGGGGVGGCGRSEISRQGVNLFHPARVHHGRVTSSLDEEELIPLGWCHDF